MDKLEEIVEGQAELMGFIFEGRQDSIDWITDVDEEMYHYDFNGALRDHVLAINDEVAELQREVDWKWWTNNRVLNRDNIDEELIDILFFTLQALILNGNDSEDIYELYMDKLQENFDRQEGKTDRKGYDQDSDENYENVD